MRGDLRKVIIIGDDEFNEKKEIGYFHAWGQIPYSIQDSNFAVTVAIVEHQDGSISMYKPTSIRFDDDYEKKIAQVLGM